MIHSPFIYRWVHIPTGKWYIGCHASKNCSTDDGYICSSKIVKPLIKDKPNEWERTVLHHGTRKEMYVQETLLLVLYGAKDNPMSFNKHNNLPYAGSEFNPHSDLTKKALGKKSCRDIVHMMVTETDPERIFLLDSYIMPYIFQKRKMV